MPRIVRSLPARDDLLQIWLYAGQHNETAADRLIDKFERTLHMLARHPLMGEEVSQYRAGLRRFTVGNYVLYYEPIAREFASCEPCTVRAKSTIFFNKSKCCTPLRRSRRKRARTTCKSRPRG